jgi:glyoxylase I family protein
MLERLHHVAYRCRDAAETTRFYEDMLGLRLEIALAENYVPSTGEWSPHIHIFFQMADGSFIAFFELPESPEMERDQATPDWVQHLALRVADMETLDKIKARLEAAGVEVLGPTDHKIFQSIYFFDPSGHRLEVAVDTGHARNVRGAARPSQCGARGMVSHQARPGSRPVAQLTP